MNTTVSEPEIKKTIRDTLIKMLPGGKTDFNDDDLFYETIGADSIVIVQVFLTCQETYDVLLSDELNLIDPISVNSLTALIRKKLAEKE